MYSLQPHIQFDYYTTPFNPGVVQYGTLVLNNDTNKTIDIQELSISPANRQLAQGSAREVLLGDNEENALSASLNYNGQYYGNSIKDASILRMPPHSNLHLGIVVQSIMYRPTGDSLVTSTDFAANPFYAWFNLDIKLSSGTYRAIIAATYSNDKK